MLPLSRLLSASTGYLCLHASLLAAPNIVFILVDDLGWTDLSTAKTNKGNQSSYYQTPNIDALAADSVCFPNCYTQQNCEPARAALITGQYPARPKNGVYNVDSLDRGNDPNSPIMAAPQRGDVDPTGTSLFETLKTAGYHIGWFGKNHGTGVAADLGVNHGVDTNYASSKQFTGIVERVEVDSAYLALPVDGPDGIPGTPDDYWTFDIPIFTTDGFAEPYSAAYDTNVLGPVANGNNVALNENTPKHHVDAVTDEAVKFIATRVATAPSVPFMLYYPITGVHTVHVSRPDLQAKYDAITSTDWRHQDPEYAALVENVDQSIGRLMNALKDPNGDGNTGDSIVGNTVIVFTSDNGSPYNVASQSFPLKGEKGMLDEGGIRVPLIMKWPGHTGNKKGKVSQQLVHLVDMYPTLAAIAGATLPNPGTYPLDGVSLTPVLDGDPNNLPIITRNLYWHFPGYMDTRGWPRSVIQETVGTKNYKLIYNYAPGLYELYNLTDAPPPDETYESINIVGSEPAIANQLAGHLNSWLSGLQAKTGTYRATGATVSYPPVPITGTDPNRPPANTYGAALRFSADASFNPFWDTSNIGSNPEFSSSWIGSTRRVSVKVKLKHANFPTLPVGKEVSFTVTFDIVPSGGALVNRTENGVGINAGGGDETPYHVDNTGTVEFVRLQSLSISNVVFTPAWAGASVSLPRFGLYRPGGKVTGTILLSKDNDPNTTGDNQTESAPTDNFDNEVLINGIPVADTLSLFPGVAGSKFTLRGLEIDYKVVLP